MHAKTTSVAINFELVCLINRTCNFRPRRTQNLVKHLRWSFFVKIVNGFKPLIIFTEKLHLWHLTRSWIHLCRSSHFRGVLKFAVKIFEKYLQRSSFLVGWQSATFSRVPWGFYLTKKFVKIVFFASFFLR